MIRLVIADVHLGEHTTNLDAFCRFVRGYARQADQLIILGDLFGRYIGDDCWLPEQERALDIIAEATASGLQVLVQRGNHDYLLGTDFYQRTGAKEMADYHLDNIEDKPALFLHGDQLCTRDLLHQQWYALYTSPNFRKLFLSMSRAARTLYCEIFSQPHAKRPELLSRHMQQHCHTETTDEQVNGLAQLKHMHQSIKLPDNIETKTSEQLVRMTGANPEAVAEFAEREQIRYMVHGHTHSPGIHRTYVKGQLCERFVLGDWSRNGWYMLIHGRPRLKSIRGLYCSARSPTL